MNDQKDEVTIIMNTPENIERLKTVSEEGNLVALINLFEKKSIVSYPIIVENPNATPEQKKAEERAQDDYREVGIEINEAFHLAVANDHTEVVKFLLAQGAEIESIDHDSDWSNTALLTAADKGYTEMVALLMAHKANTKVISWLGDTALSLATSQGHTEIVQLLKKPISAAGYDALGLLGRRNSQPQPDIALNLSEQKEEEHGSSAAVGATI